jgi:C1A family cysteine protease
MKIINLFLNSIIFMMSFTSVFSEPRADFSNFITKYNKNYDSIEYEHRFNVFNQNLDLINNHNTQNHSWKMEVNNFADISIDEFNGLYKTYKKTDLIESIPRTNFTYSLESLPDNFDWTALGAVTPVKNQQQCGSCWAFSTTGSTEGAWFLKNHKLLSLSEQQLVDCSKPQGNDGCSGGLMDQGFKYIEQNVLCLENDYPYTAADGTCKTTCKSVVKISSFVDVPENNEVALQNAVHLTPVSVAVEADQWQFYSSGVLTTTCGTNLDHGVLLVGWGVDSNNVPFWKVKNSWGTEWGDEGYILLQRGVSSSGQCGIAMQPSYPVV